jgi:hypothetical protein
MGAFCIRALNTYDKSLYWQFDTDKILAASEENVALGLYGQNSFALSMTKQVSAVSKSRFHQIQNIGRIRKYITEDACRTLVCSLVTSRLDCGNALLYGLDNSIDL